MRAFCYVVLYCAATVAVGAAVVSWLALLQ